MIFGEHLINKLDYGTVYGSTALKSLQNDNIPELDLLVREAIQNSSDAARSVADDHFVVCFNVGLFEASRLNAELHQIGKKLDSVFPEKEYEYFEIRDIKTSGLTGPYRKSEINRNDHGNYFKLIFDTGKKQDQIGSGGNWGFGKSVYYRVGLAGLAFFYTRIKKETGYEERLVGTMIEDETSPDSILCQIEPSSTGRAWWGRPGINPGDDRILPITNAKSIREFLSIFGLKPFSGDETGTSVVIPYVDSARLLSEAIPEETLTETERRRCWWADSIEDYLTHAIRKWYAPKLLNKALRSGGIGGKILRARVNGQLVRHSEMPPFFQLVQDLYNASLFACYGIEPPKSEFGGIRTDAISVSAATHGLKTKCAGYVSYIRISRKELTRDRPTSSPYSLSGNYDGKSDENEPIVMFAREPGMVIDYSISGEWTKGVHAPMKPEEGSFDEEFIFAFFVPNVFNEFDAKKNPERARKYVNLGGYLRDCEGSDHVNWVDNKELTLVSKIKYHVGSKIKAGTRKEEDSPGLTAPMSRLSGKVGKLLMPPVNYGGNSGGGGGGGGGGHAGASKKFAVTSVAHRSDCIIVSFVLPMAGKNEKSIRVEITSESERLSKEKWIEDTGMPFPLQISEAAAFVRKPNGSEEWLRISSNHGSIEDGSLAISWANGADDGIRSAVAFCCSDCGMIVEGELVLDASTRKYRFDVKEA